MRGLAALPTEVLHQMIPYMPLETDVPWYLETPTIVKRSERKNLLRVLSQICRSLRDAFLPLLWERIDRCSFIVPSGDHRNYTRKRVEILGKQLLGQLRFVTDGRESYGWCVRYSLFFCHGDSCLVSIITQSSRIINVVIHSEFANAVLTRLARAMSLMPNLHTIQIIYSGPLYSYAIQPDQFQKAFAGLVFPSVKHVTLPFQARRILACFPEATEVYSNQSYMPDFVRFLDNVVRHCRKITTFGWVQCPIVIPAASKTNYGMCMTFILYLTLHEEYSSPKASEYSQSGMLFNRLWISAYSSFVPKLSDLILL
jgi:hypothetical protein